MAKILAIDDDPYFLISLNNFLTFQKHQLTTVQNTYLVKEIIQNHHFDCLLLDIQMPGLNGLELLKFIRQFHPEMPIIILSGMEYSKYQKELNNYKYIEFIEKPFNPLVLLGAINRLTHSPQTE